MLVPGRAWGQQTATDDNWAAKGPGTLDTWQGVLIVADVLKRSEPQCARFIVALVGGLFASAV
jgi:hypothetical protein